MKAQLFESKSEKEIRLANGVQFFAEEGETKMVRTPTGFFDKAIWNGNYRISEGDQPEEGSTGTQSEK